MQSRPDQAALEIIRCCADRCAGRLTGGKIVLSNGPVAFMTSGLSRRPPHRQPGAELRH
jgi:hypothetical protein